MDPEAVLYFRYVDCVYRCKVFTNTVSLERQIPRGDNIIFDRAMYPVFDGTHWEIVTLAGLVQDYQFVNEVNP